MANPYLLVGRGNDCQLVLSHASVSTHHAKLSWKNGLVRIEDVGSANGIWVQGKRVRDVLVRPGDEVHLGEVALPWSREELVPFLRLGGQGTVFGTPQTSLRNRIPPLKILFSWVLLGFSIMVGVMALFPGGRERIRSVIEGARDRIGQWQPARSDEEAYVRSRVAPKVREAIDPTNPLSRDTAVQIAARVEGPFRVEQVAAIWQRARERWRYVNDPQGREYFAKGSESIRNNFAGDCDDFAITLATLVGAIGGQTRVVMMEGTRGGHAYAEVCIQEPPNDVATKLARYYGRTWARYSTRGRPASVHFRTSEACPVWLNLDWFSEVPGGAYDAEQWAVAVYPDGRTETLVPSGRTTAPRANSASAPRTMATPRE